MTTLGFNRYVLQCEGCPARFGEPHGYNSPDIARTAAREQGWGTPPIRRATGQLGVITSDVCPDCRPNWEPVTMATRQHGRRLAPDEAPASWPTPATTTASRPTAARLDRPTPGELLTPRHVHEQYGFSPQTLANWRWCGQGPAYIKTSSGRGGRIMYRKSAIETWLNAQTVQTRDDAT